MTDLRSKVAKLANENPELRVHLVPILKKANFNSDSDKWEQALFEDIVEGRADDYYLATVFVTKSKPTEANLNKFKIAVARGRGRWVRYLLQFIKKIQDGDYSREFKKTYGPHSQVSELFSFFRQAVANAEAELEVRAEGRTSGLKVSLLEKDLDKLTPEDWMGFAIMLGYKSVARPYEAQRIGVDLEKVKKNLIRIGLMKGNRLVPQARDAWKLRFPTTLPSQLHQVAPKVHYKAPKLARDGGFLMELGDTGITEFRGRAAEFTFYHPIENIGKRGKIVEVTSAGFGMEAGGTAWDWVFKDRVKKVKGYQNVMKVWNQVMVEALAENPKRWTNGPYTKKVKGVDQSLPTPKSHMVEDIKGPDIYGDLNAKPIRFYIKSETKELEKGRMVYWFKVHPRFKARLQALASEIAPLRGRLALTRLLDANKIPYDYHSYMDPMFD